jgi:preprotein translocase SecE subunit
MDRIKAFFNGVKKESERVRWPSRKNMMKDSGAVLALCFFLGIFFYLVNVSFVLIKEVLS